MAIQQQALRYGQRRVIKRAGRVLPWIGTAIALMAFTAVVRRKGFFRGTADTALNAIPVVGGLKSLAELVRGREFIPDRTRA